MPGSTTELSLQTAVDSDDNADYLTISLANSLRTVDALFNNVSGHNHNGAHQGGPIASIPASAIPVGSITSAMIADGTIGTADLADGSVTSAKIADGTITGADIAASTITSGNILDGTILSLDIASNTITSANIQDGTIQTVDIADAQITTAKIVANNVQNRIGNYGALATWSTTSTGSWVATPVTVTVPSAGNLLRIEATLTMQHSAGGGWYVGLGQDGALATNNFFCQNQANFAMPITIVQYLQPGAGSHTYTVWVQNASAGTLAINASTYSYLFVTEQLR